MSLFPGDSDLTCMGLTGLGGWGQADGRTDRGWWWPRQRFELPPTQPYVSQSRPLPRTRTAKRSLPLRQFYVEQGKQEAFGSDGTERGCVPTSPYTPGDVSTRNRVSMVSKGESRLMSAVLTTLHGPSYLLPLLLLCNKVVHFGGSLPVLGRESLGSCISTVLRARPLGPHLGLCGGGDAW